MMMITEKQRFVYAWLVLTCATISLLAVFQVYALEIFLVVMIIEFLALVELTHPASFSVSWRRNITVCIVICLIVFAIILYRHAVTVLS